MKTLLQDIRFGVRQLVKIPGFSLTAIVSLALGIGATTAVFSVVYAILMDPYPYKDSNRMIHMRLTMPSGELNGFGVTGTQWQQLRKSPVVEDTFMEDDWSLTVTGADLPEDVQGVYLTSNAFNFFGVPAALGRGLQPSDATDGEDPQPVVVLGYKFWLRHYSGDSSVIGKTIQLMRKNYTIVGVAGSRFTWGDAGVYLPLKVTGDQVKGFYAGVRLKPGVTQAQANAALEPLIRQFAKESPKHFPPDFTHLHVVGLNEDFVKQLGGTLYLLFGAVALLNVGRELRIGIRRRLLGLRHRRPADRPHCRQPQGQHAGAPRDHGVGAAEPPAAGWSPEGLLMNWPISAIRSIEPCVSVIVSPLLSGVGLPPGFIAMKVEPSSPSEVIAALESDGNFALGSSAMSTLT